MRLIGNLIIALALVAGLLSAATAYLPRTDLPDGRLEGLTLAAPAGVRNPDAPPGDREPIVPADEGEGEGVLTTERLTQLRDAGVERIRVKEFAFGRWEGRWVFVGSFIALLSGAFLVRLATRAAATAPVSGGEAATPEALLAEMRQRLEALRSQVKSAAGDDQRMRLIVDEVGELQETHLQRLPDARQRLVAQMGLGGYANFMDAYAAAERQLNRAWSAAADEHLEEALASLGRGVDLLGEAQRRLESSGA